MHWDDFSIFDFVNIPIFVLVPDKDNRPVYQFLNRVARQRLNATPDQICGRPACEIFAGRAAWSVYHRQCAAWTDGVVTEYEIALPLGPEVIWVRTRLEPVCDDAGNITHMIGASQDISAERDQLHAHMMSVADAREMDDLVCMAAHDLRSPIANLKTLAELLREDFVDHGDGKAELIDMVETISDKALTVISGIMGRAMSAEVINNVSTFDIGEMCDDIMVMLDPIGIHNVTYPRHSIRADFTAVHIILRNLIDNALKHSGQACARVSIDVATMNAERLKFTVCDNGDGFAAGSYRNPPDADCRIKGGFGLTGVRRLARSRGGQVEVVSPTAGKGAEVQVEIPGRIVSGMAGAGTTLSSRAG